MQHLFQFICKIDGKPFHGEVTTDKSRKSKIPAEIEKVHSLNSKGTVSELMFRQLR